MPADPADIGPAMREAAVETWSDAAIKARFPSAADGAAEPAEGLFQEAADAAAAIAARAALLGVERRRFAVTAQDLLWLDPLSGVPTVTLVDDDQSVSGPMLVARLELNLNDETTSLELFG